MDPEEIVRHFDRLKIALETRNRHAVAAIALSLLENQAQIGQRWQTIATLLFHSGELRAAIVAIQNYVAASGNAPHAEFERAALMAQAGRLHEAYLLLQTIPSDIPNIASHAFLSGTIAMNMGNLDEAKDKFNAALDENKLLGQAMLQLSLIEKHKDDSDVGNQICLIEPYMTDAQPIDQIQYKFALGKVHFDRRQYSDAFTCFSQGAAMGAGFRPYDAAADRNSANACRKGYHHKSIQEISSKITIDTSRPIFVTGLARSGTTLVEQILASHSRVVGGEELGRMPLVESDVGGPDAECLNRYCKLSGHNKAAETYLHLASERFGDVGNFVDKSLEASRHMGLIASILPQAAIIWVRRNPLDCAWSVFRTYFASGLEWSWRLENIAYHFRLEELLFRHWKAVLGDRILEIQYEDLVSEPHGQISRLLRHCNLAEEDGPFAPHKTIRAVTTASVAQVRQPINTSSIGASKSYIEFLKPFIDAYD